MMGDEVFVVAELMLEASSRVWQAERDRKDLARELLDQYGEAVVRAACRQNRFTHRTWLNWGLDARDIPESERLLDRSPQKETSPNRRRRADDRAV